MPVPWLQIVQLVPSILDVSRELLRKSRTLAPPMPSGDAPNDALAARIMQLGGGVSLALFAGFLTILIRRDKKRTLVESTAQ